MHGVRESLDGREPGIRFLFGGVYQCFIVVVNRDAHDDETTFIKMRKQRADWVFGPKSFLFFCTKRGHCFCKVTSFGINAYLCLAWQSYYYSLSCSDYQQHNKWLRLKIFPCPLWHSCVLKYLLCNTIVLAARNVETLSDAKFQHCRHDNYWLKWFYFVKPTHSNRESRKLSD